LKAETARLQEKVDELEYRIKILLRTITEVEK